MLTLVSILAGCADYGLSGALGVSPGGSQDIAYARTLVENGSIPAHEHFTAEGLFSEHDLPLASPGCDAVLCPVAAAAPVDFVDERGARMLVQLGFDTRLTAETFERPPLALSVAVDVSGSMSGPKIEAVRHALGVLVDQLGPDDRMALVAFDDRAWVESPMIVTDAEGREELHELVDGLVEGGGTSIEAGLVLAYGEVAPLAAEAGVEQRVMLFTDAQPNVGDTSMNGFLGMVRYYAEAGIGISVFGVGLDMGTELADAIARTRGGSYSYLAEPEDVSAVFDEEFDYLVTPVAYDLEVVVEPAEGARLDAGYGVPVDGPATRATLGASTLFLSSRDGGMGATFFVDEATAGEGIARFSLAYETPEGEAEEAEIAVAWEGGAVVAGREVAADDLGVYKMSVLIEEFLALGAGADFCEGTLEREPAIARIEEARERVATVADHLADDPMGEEVRLLAELADNVRGGRGNCAAADNYEY